MDSTEDGAFAEPRAAAEEARVSFTPPTPGSRSRITEVIERNRVELTEIEGVHGVAEGRTPTGDDAVRVDVDDDAVRERLPETIEGYPVEVVVVPGGFGTLPAGSHHTG